MPPESIKYFLILLTVYHHESVNISLNWAFKKWLGILLSFTNLLPFIYSSFLCPPQKSETTSFLCQDAFPFSLPCSYFSKKPFHRDAFNLQLPHLGICTLSFFPPSAEGKESSLLSDSSSCPQSGTPSIFLGILHDWLPTLSLSSTLILPIALSHQPLDKLGSPNFRNLSLNAISSSS